MRTILIIATCLIIVACQQTESNKNIIRVAGEGKVRAMPDQVILTLSVSFTEPRMVDAVRKTQQTVDSVLNILSAFSKNQTDIKTSSISANKEYTYTNSGSKFIGYQSNQSIDFVLNDLTKFTSLTGKLLETKINKISNIQFNHSKADSLFREADLLAYDDALQSANKLTKRADSKIGKLLFISNTNSTSDRNNTNHYYNSIDTYNKGFGGRGFNISPEVIEFKRNIITEFELIN